MKFHRSVLLLVALAPPTESFAPWPVPRTAPSSQQVGQRPSCIRTSSLASSVSPFQGLLDNISFLPKMTSSVDQKTDGEAIVERFLEAYNQGDIDTAISFVAEDCKFEDMTFLKPCQCKDDLERRLRLQLDAFSQTVVIDDSTSEGNKVGVKFHFESDENKSKNKRGIAFCELDDQDKIASVSWFVEPSSKSGEDGLKILSGATKIMEVTGYNPAKSKTPSSPWSSAKTAPEKYFEAWSRRDMGAAIAVFAEDVSYDDTAFPEPFIGKEKLKEHLLKCSAAFPPTFTFDVDDIINGGNKMVVRWHVENGGEQLPFTQGCSFYELGRNGLIRDGIDFVDAEPIKSGGMTLFLESMKTKLVKEPARVLPLFAWAAYMYIVFFSDGILPGANALQLEQRTWEEVRDLSLNFFLVAPLLNLPFSPVVHPMLEGVFNLLLSWAALFAGFLSDDRKDKPNLLPMFPIVVGMQLLTSAFLLPYLATRSTENRSDVSREDLSRVAQVCESRALGPALATVGAGSIVWAFVGRFADFGELGERWSSFIDLLSIDRVGSSFIVDLAIFAIFQAWFVDDDLKRRGAANDNMRLAFVGKYIPFFGMAAYLALRPALPSKATGSQE